MLCCRLSCQAQGSSAWNRGIFGPFVGPRRYVSERLGVSGGRSVHIQRPLRIDAFVILPDPLHCIWTLAPNDADFSTRWRLIQSSFSRAIAPGEPLSSRRRTAPHICWANGAFDDRQSWRSPYGRFASKFVPDEFVATAILGARDPGSKGFLCAPRLHSLQSRQTWVSRVADWPHSSFHRYVRSGWYPLEWMAPADVREWALE